MTKVRLGILGVSWWTEVVWPGFSQAENVEITWIAARDLSKAEKFASQHGIPNFTDSYRKLISAPDVDAVFIAVPNFLHQEMGIAALAAGKHVYQEKPMALTSEKAVAQAQIAASKGRVLMLNHELRHSPGLADIKAVVADRIGSIRKVLIGLSLEPKVWEGWRADPSLSGGTLFEMLIHELDLARWLFGRNPLSIYAQGEDVSGKDMTLILDFGQGDMAVIDVCWRTIGFRLRVECQGERGYLRREAELSLGVGTQTLVTAEGTSITEFESGAQSPETFKRMLEGFANSILTGAPVSVTAEDGIWGVRMAEAARLSLERGEPVMFATFL